MSTVRGRLLYLGLGKESCHGTGVAKHYCSFYRSKSLIRPCMADGGSGCPCKLIGKKSTCVGKWRCMGVEGGEGEAGELVFDGRV